MNKIRIKQWSEDVVRSMVGENLADAWWQQPNKAFEGKTPDSVFEEDPIKIYTYLVKSAEGDW
jgi:hypothetical protein